MKVFLTIKMIIVFTFLIGLCGMVHGQEYRSIDNKGTKITVRNTSTTSGSATPSNPVLNDIWFDTSDADRQLVKIWNGSAWTALTFTGIPGSVFFAGSDGIPTQDNDQLFWDNNNKRLGIGTSTPSQSLDVEGYARIGSMDYSGSSDEIVKVDSGGILHTSKVNYGGRWTNTDINTNFNIDGTVVPIFGSNTYVDDGTNLYEVSGNTLIVKEAGRYDIRLNVALLGIDDSALNLNEFDTNVYVRIAINGTPVSAYGASGHISFNNGQREASVHLSEILQLSASDVISILAYREANSGTVRLNGSGSSSFVINKLR